MSNKIIEVHHLTKSYGDFKAVDDISFYVERGKLFSFLGPNGAGKSTTIDILCTLLRYDNGDVVIDGYHLGHQNQAIRHKIGVVFQDNMLDALLTVRENLRIRAGFYFNDKASVKQAVAEAVQLTDLSEFLNRPYGKLSGGQRRRADIARALLNKPKILFLDEPTTGLDPQTRRSIWETILGLKDELGMTIFLTTHYMEEAAQSDYVIIIDDGKIAAKGTPDELEQRYTTDVLRLSYRDKQSLCGLLNAQAISYEESQRSIIIRLSTSFDALPLIEMCRPYIDDFQVLNGTMDDAFIAITGKEIRS